MKLHSDPSESDPRLVQDTDSSLEVVCRTFERLDDGNPEDEERSVAPEMDKNLLVEIQQAYKIFQNFLSEKHKSITAPFWHVGAGEMSFTKMDEKFVKREYDSITAFVADFRLMLENCYRSHGVDHWISKQAQKLETILEQKLTLLSRSLREKTTLAVTSGGRFGLDDEKTLTRRRSTSRTLGAVTVGGAESVMMQVVRQEELQRARGQRKQRELDRKEASEASVKELEDWETSLLSLAEATPLQTLWELPAIGHFLCLAQMVLNLPEIVFYELERCLLMPRCSSLLAKVMTSLLLPSHKRSTLHRRPPLAYRKWEAELRRRVQGWYEVVGRSEEPVSRAERLGLCHQFFWTLGSASPLEEMAFHLLPLCQRVWLLKGLCDHVYETQKDVQDAVLGQPIHECRETILGYDGQENVYIHFPHFCGADLRIYRQSASRAVEFPLPPFHVKRSEGSEVKLEQTETSVWPEQNCSGEKPSAASPSLMEEEKVEQGSVLSFRVGDGCYKGRSPVVNAESHSGPKDGGSEESGASETRPGCGVKKRRRPREKVHTDTPSLKKKKINTSGVEKIKRQKLGLKARGKRRSTSAPAPHQPAFQLVCSSLDDLRRLIGTTEDELKDLKQNTQRSGVQQHRRAAVKELHITLIRLLKELLPWEPKLVKAFQRNRARLKKECDYFRKHPEFEHFTREETSPTKSDDIFCDARDSDDGDMKTEQTSTHESEKICLLGYQKSNSPSDGAEVHMAGQESGPFTRSLKRRLTSAINEEVKRSTTDLESSQSSRVEPTSTEAVPINPNSSGGPLSDLQSSFPGTCSLIQALLAKSDGNKVTLTNHPKAAVVQSQTNKMPPAAPPDKPSVTSAPVSHSEPTESLVPMPADRTGQVIYKTSGGLGLLRTGPTSGKLPVQPVPKQKVLVKQHVVLPSDLLGQKTERKAVFNTPERTPKTITAYVSHTSGFTIPENRVPVQEVAPMNDALDVKPSPAVLSPSSTITSGVSTVPTNTIEPVIQGRCFTRDRSAPTKPDMKQELRTVCIRDSQSILVTTRGGNTGVVKVLQSEKSKKGVLPASPVFAISSQLQTFLVSKSSTSTTQASITAKQRLTPDVTSVRSSPLVAATMASTFIPTTSSSSAGSSSRNLTRHVSLIQTTTEKSLALKNIPGLQQNIISKGPVILPQKRPQREISDPSTFKKVFLVTPSINSPPQASTTGCTAQMSKVKFASHTASDFSELSISKGPAENSTSHTSSQRFGSQGVASVPSKPGIGGIENAESSQVLGKIRPVSVTKSTSSDAQTKNNNHLFVGSKSNGSHKVLTFSTLGTGHMASSELLSAIKPDGPSSVFNTLNKSGLSVNSAPNVSLLSLIGMYTTAPVDGTANKTHEILSQPLGTSAPFRPVVSGNLVPIGHNSTVTPPVVVTPAPGPQLSTTKMQEKIVINSSAPLAPGTQLLINNTRFVVPKQGLGPGSHVLLISSPCPGVLQAPQAATPPVYRDPPTSGLFPQLLNSSQLLICQPSVSSPGISKADVSQLKSQIHPLTSPNSTVTMSENLPIPMVPPVSSAINNSGQASLTIPLSSNTVIVKPCQSLKALKQNATMGLQPKSPSSWTAPP